MVINKDTDINKCIEVALKQTCNNQKLGDIYKEILTTITDTYATIESAASLKTDISDTFAGFKQDAAVHSVSP